MMDRYPALMARDCIHAATCANRRIPTICSYDRDFDVFPDLRRVEPDA